MSTDEPSQTRTFLELCLVLSAAFAACFADKILQWLLAAAHIM